MIPKREEMVLGRPRLRWHPAAALLLIVPYIVWAGYRGTWFGDTGLYISLYRDLPSSFSGMSEYLSRFSKDKGYSIFSFIFKSVFGSNYVLFFLFIAAVQLVIIALVYRKYSEDYWFSIFIFIASTDYMSWVHNGMRQFIAVTIIFAATTLILKKKYILVLLLILLASTFHLSALLMIPVLLIAQGKAWNWRTWALLFAVVVVLFSIDRFTDLLDTWLSDTQYASIVSDWIEWQDNGTNPIRVLVYSIPLILSIIGRRYVREEGDELINMCVGLSICTTLLYLVSMVTSGIFIGRLPIYMSLYATGILLPWLIHHIFTEHSIKLIKIAAVVLFSVYFYYSMHVQWHII